jgi:hypothetical protein
MTVEKVCSQMHDLTVVNLSWLYLLLNLCSISVLHVKKVCGCDYLLGRKWQAYHTIKTINLPLTYLTIKLFNLALLLEHLGFDVEQTSDRRRTITADVALDPQFCGSTVCAMEFPDGGFPLLLPSFLCSLRCWSNYLRLGGQGRWGAASSIFDASANQCLAGVTDSDGYGKVVATTPENGHEQALLGARACWAGVLWYCETLIMWPGFQPMGLI